MMIEKISICAIEKTKKLSQTQTNKTKQKHRRRRIFVHHEETEEINRKPKKQQQQTKPTEKRTSTVFVCMICFSLIVDWNFALEFSDLFLISLHCCAIAYLNGFV